MANENITPEEKLLKIIENPEIAKYKVSAENKEKVIKIKALVAWLKGLRINRDTLKYLNLRTANRIAVVFCGFLTIFWIYGFVKSQTQLKKRFAQMTTGTFTPETGKKERPTLQVEIRDILTQAKKRNIFTLLSPKTQGTVTLDISKIISNLKLVGIIWSDNPQAMIEDTKDSKTYLLSTGEEIGQSLKIKKIFRDKVIISNEEQEWELR